MTNLRGMTIEQFNNTIEEMRATYPFKNSETRIVSTIHEPSYCHRQLEIYTINEDHDVKVILMKEVEVDDEY